MGNYTAVEYLFNHVVFNDEKWVVSSQQPPTHQQGDLRRVDIVVEKMDSNAVTVGTILLLEAKRASASPSDIEEVEYQAFTAACAYFAETGTKRIWTMTCVGSKARLWIFADNSTYLIPYVPLGQGLAERSEYLEISTHGKDIMNGLDFIKRHPTPPENCIGPSSPRPAKAVLPQNWHDNEVVQLDSYYGRLGPVSAGASMDWEAGPSMSSASWNAAGTQGLGLGEEVPLPDGVPNFVGTVGVDFGSAPNPSGTMKSLSIDSPWRQQGESGEQREVEVDLTRVHHTFSKDELLFKRRGHTQISTEDDWRQEKREGRTVWVYRHGKTQYWTKSLG